jgi:hypothetical protein
MLAFSIKERQRNLSLQNSFITLTMSRNSKLSKTRATFNDLIFGVPRITKKRILATPVVSRKRRRTSSPDEEEGDYFIICVYRNYYLHTIFTFKQTSKIC